MTPWLLPALAFAQTEPLRQRALSLSVVPVTEAGDLALAVRPIDSDERAAWFLSVRGSGAGPCPSWLEGACLSLLDPVELGDAVVDRSGVARLVTQVALPVGTDEVWLQAVVVDARGEPWLSEVATRRVWDDAMVLDGDLVIGDRAELAAAADWGAVTGDVRVEGSDLEELDLRALEEVGGEVRVWENDQLEAVWLPALTLVGEDLSLYDADPLDELELPALEAVGGTLSINRLEGLTRLWVPELHHAGGLYVFHAPLLPRLRFPSLAWVAGQVELWELYAMHTVRLPSLVRVQGKLDLFEGHALTRLTAPQLEELGGYEVHQCDQLASAWWLPSLRVVGGAITLKYADAMGHVSLPALEHANALTALELPALQSWTWPSLATVGGEVRVEATGLGELGLYALSEAGSLTVRDNGDLEALGLESAQFEGLVRVTGNPALSTCEVEAWADELGHAAVLCGGNLDDGCSALCVP